MCWYIIIVVDLWKSVRTSLVTVDNLPKWACTPIHITNIKCCAMKQVNTEPSMFIPVVDSHFFYCSIIHVRLGEFEDSVSWAKIHTLCKQTHTHAHALERANDIESINVNRLVSYVFPCHRKMCVCVFHFADYRVCRSPYMKSFVFTAFSGGQNRPFLLLVSCILLQMLSPWYFRQLWKTATSIESI